MKKRYGLFLLLFLITGCTSKYEKKLIGSWIVDSLVLNGAKQELSYNMIVFDKNEKCHLPLRNLYDPQKGTWQIENKGEDHYVTIRSFGSIFEGKYRLVFYKDPERMLNCMKLTSNEVQIQCSRFLDGYRD